MSDAEMRPVPNLDAHVTGRPATRSQINFLATIAVNRINDDKFDPQPNNVVVFGDLYSGEDYSDGVSVRIALRSGQVPERPNVHLAIGEYFPSGSTYDEQLVRLTECQLRSRGFFHSRPYRCHSIRESYARFDGMKLSPLFDYAASDFSRREANEFDAPYRTRQVLELETMLRGKTLLTRTRCAELIRLVATFDPARAHVVIDNRVG